MQVNHATNCECDSCRMTFKGQRRGASHPPEGLNAQWFYALCLLALAASVVAACALAGR